ncbi:MAG: tetratricopeptide repeat protein, partial [Anaerolineales bacterium]
MKKRTFYQLSFLIILIGTLFIGGMYLLSNRRFEEKPAEDTPLTSNPDALPAFTPQPTSTPILPPLQSSISGDIYYFYGDWESAIVSYEETLGRAETPEEGSAALLGLGKVFYQKGDYQK